MASADRHEYRNDLESAARLYKESQQLLQIQRRDPKVAALHVRSLCGLACIRRQQGRFKISERMYRRALQIAEEAFGPEHQIVSTVLNDLGVLLKYAGRFTEAGQLYQRALANTEKNLGPSHPEVATVYHNLSGLEHAAGNFARAESFGRYALKLRRKIVGAAHPDCALEMAALAPILDGRHKFAEAARLYRRALPVLERIHGSGHPDVMVALNNLAANAQARGRPGEAARIYRRTLAMKERVFGADHPTIATTLNNLAVLLKQQKKYLEADAIYRRALKILEHALGPRHLNTAACLDNYAQLLRRMRRSGYARHLEARASRIRRGIETLADDNTAVTATINPLFTRFRLSMRPSAIHRWGVFADEAIPARRKVIEYAGERVSRNAARRRFNPDKVYFYRISGDRIVDGAAGGSGAEFINHCCAPNLVARKSVDRIDFVSTRKIAAGEELTVDYQFSRRLKKVPCHCGAPNCRGTINVA